MFTSMGLCSRCGRHRRRRPGGRRSAGSVRWMSANGKSDEADRVEREQAVLVAVSTGGTAMIRQAPTDAREALTTGDRQGTTLTKETPHGELDNKVAIIAGAGSRHRGIHREAVCQAGSPLVIDDPGSSPDDNGGDQGAARDVAAEIVAAGGRAVSDGGDIADVATGHGCPDRDRNVREARYSRQCRRHPPRPHDLQPRGGRLGCCHLRSLQGSLQHGPPCGSLLPITAQPRRALLDHQLHVGVRLAGLPRPPNYGAAKMGTVGLTYSLAQGLACSLRRYSQRHCSGCGDSADRNGARRQEDRRRGL